MVAHSKNLRGQTFHNLTPLLSTSRREVGSVIWHCACSCGQHCFVSQREIVRGNTKSCGCRDLLTMRQHNLRKVKPRALPRGVYQTKEGGFKALISEGNKLKYLGTFDNVDAASEAYLLEARRVDNE